MFARKPNVLKNESGFTLVELLVVIIIIGILAAIAVPIFLNQRQYAYDSAVKSDVKRVVNSIQDNMVKNPDASDIQGVSSNGTLVMQIDGQPTETIQLSKLVAVTVEPGEKASEFFVYGYHSEGQRFYDETHQLVYDSSRGGIRETTGSPVGASGTP